jgi:hypothetical protein
MNEWSERLRELLMNQRRTYKIVGLCSLVGWFRFLFGVGGSDVHSADCRKLFIVTAAIPAC